MRLDPILTAEQIRASYLRYLKTAFPLADPDLAQQFDSELNQEGGFIKGPYLEITPPFETGTSIASLVKDGLLSSLFQRLDSRSLPLDRPLWKHQEEAIRKSVQYRRNLVIATGTGSGKTEAFLIPILNYLFRQLEKTRALDSGVRALLLYPMNALANDQLKRLRRLLSNCPEISFGRYTGETKESQREAEEHFAKFFPREPRVSNELLSRERMRSRPPHLLLTNYAMLEYLLLRPRDCEFFDGPTAKQWRFLTLDEAHTYSGAVGIEMAMLLRRLKDRVIQSEPGRLQCFATSATLGTAGSYDEMVDFARRIFGETFEWVTGDATRQDVVEATRIALDNLALPRGEPRIDLYERWKMVLDSTAEVDQKLASLCEIGRECGVPNDVLTQAHENAIRTRSQDSLATFLYHSLRKNGHLFALRKRLADQVELLEVIARDLFTEAGADAAIHLVDLAAQARSGPEDQPLLPARYHLFVRALEGSYVGFSRKPILVLDRRETFNVNGKEHRAFEAATCRRCGHLYLAGNIATISGVSSRLVHPRVSPDEDIDIDLFFVVEKEGIPDVTNEDEQVEFESSASATDEEYLLCNRCGAIERSSSLYSACDCDSRYKVRLLKVSSSETKQTHCPGCGARGKQLVVRFLTGQDAANSVLATALYQRIPARPTEDWSQTPAMTDEWVTSPVVRPESKDSGSRKLLAFSDSRQDAAFFACYLDRTYRQILRRRLLIKVLSHCRKTGSVWRAQDLVAPCREEADEIAFFGPEWSDQQKTSEIWKWILLELLALDRRNSLEGLGIGKFELAKPKGWVPPRPLLMEPWNLSPDEAWLLYSVLLESFRLQGALSFPAAVSPKDEEFSPRDRPYYFRGQGASPQNGIYGWSTTKAGVTNRRHDFLKRLLKHIGPEFPDSQLRDTLSGIWRSLTAPTSPLADYFRVETIRDEGIVYQMRPCFYTVNLTSGQPEDGSWLRCDKCGALSTLCLRQTCLTYKCDGHLLPCQPDKELQHNHYRALYLSLKPIPMKIEEHTAQLTSEAAAELQERFVHGDVNILSCSTTFELGVDVGELEAVLLKNVPPETANYVQRAGRAGRRTQSTAFAVTFCQRRSHDLYYFQHPERIIAGSMKPPYFEILNEKIIRRHLHSIAFSQFFRRNDHLFGTIEDFFMLGGGRKSGPELLQEYLATRPASIYEAIHRVTPKELLSDLGVADWTWTEDLFDREQGRLYLASQEVRTDLRNLEDYRRELFSQNRPSDHIQRVINTILKGNLIDFLANRNVLPKYGFPVDVVGLEILHHGEHARRLELQRDLRIAISEYAPESQVVAGSRLWKSHGLKRIPHLDWPRFQYAICKTCRHYNRVRANAGSLPPGCVGCGTKFDQSWLFVEPRFGFQTYAHDKPGRPGDSRPPRTFTSRVFFAGEERSRETVASLKLQGICIEINHARHGKLAVLNQAKFRICGLCGFAVKSGTPVPRKHKTSLGRDCSGTLFLNDLGHEFLSDICELRVEGYTVGDYDSWFSVLYSLLEGASNALSIRRDDLDGCLYPYRGLGPPALILFDNVPGGAGHVRRVAENLLEVLYAARERVDGRCRCGGGPEGPGTTSCYGCLRNYRNQFYHDQLKRVDALNFLNRALNS